MPEIKRRDLKVWLIDTQGVPHVVGELSVDLDSVCFRYTSDEFVLDPINLPVSQDLVCTSSLEPPLLVFDDTVPDSWGLDLLAYKYKVDFRHNRHLALGFGDTSGIGAIFYSDREDPALPRPTWVNFQVLSKFFKDIDTFDIRKVNQIFEYLGLSGTHIGGTKPKTILVDFQGQPWLVKFPAPNDPTPKAVACVEVEGLSFARDVGIPVPKFMLLKMPLVFCIAVKRFDITRLNPPYLGRKVIISLSTMMGGLDRFDEGYEYAAEIIKRVSYQPERDVFYFFKQMLLNWFIVNTDDHLKNFSFLWDGKELVLSPAYDLVGNLWGMAEHTMPINGKTKDISPGDLLAAAQNMGIPELTAKEELANMLERGLIFFDRIQGVEGTELLAEKVGERLEELRSVKNILV